MLQFAKVLWGDCEEPHEPTRIKARKYPGLIPDPLGCNLTGFEVSRPTEWIWDQW